MKRTKKPVIKEEIVSVEMTADEFAEIAAQECANALAVADDDDMGFAITLSMAFAEFSARLMHRIFDDIDGCEAEG